MQQTQPSYQPLNGKEIREAAIKILTRRINEIPRMKEGHAYHNANIVFSFMMTATPADCPVPTAEWEAVIEAPGFNIQDDYVNITNKAESLKNKKEQLLAQIAKIDSLLEIVELTVEIEDGINASGSKSGADEVRIENDLPIPRIVKETTPTGGVKMTEKFINYNELSR